MKFKIYLFLIPLLILLSCAEKDKVPAYKAATEGELAPVKLPQIQEKTLDNGLKIIVVEQHELPLVSFRLMVKSGATNDPKKLAGLASFTANLLTKGTESRSAVDIANEIDFIGGNLRASADWDRSNVSCQVLTRHFDTGLGLFADVILNPVFQNSEIERLRKRSISAYISSREDPANLANEYFAEFLFGEHPFGYRENGTQTTLQNIERSDIVDFYKAYYAPNNSVIVVAGDVEPEMVFSALEEKFSNWKRAEIPQLELPEPEAPAGYKILLVDKPDATQSQVRMGHLGIARSNPDYFSISLMNYIYGGGGFSSRLMQTVRADMGLTYSVHSSFNYHKIPGSFVVSTFTKNESVGAAIKEIINQMKIMQEEPVEADELADAQSYYNGSYPMRFETPNQIAGQLLHVELFDLGEGYIEQYRDNIRAVTLDGVKGCAAKYLKPNDIAIVVVGKKDEVYDQLTPFGEVEVREID